MPDVLSILGKLKKPLQMLARAGVDELCRKKAEDALAEARAAREDAADARTAAAELAEQVNDLRERLSACELRDEPRRVRELGGDGEPH